MKLPDSDRRRLRAPGQLDAAAFAGAAEDPDFSPDFAVGFASEPELDSLLLSDAVSLFDSLLAAGELVDSEDRESFR